MGIRDYKEGDAEEIAHLFHETVHSVNRPDYSREQVEAWASGIPDAAEWHRRMAARKTLVADQAGEVVGFAELEEDGHLDMLYVRNDLAGRGIGQGLYQAAEDVARALGVGLIFTESSITVRPFFKRQGFRIVREQTVRRRRIGLTNFAMEKSIRP